MKNIKDTDLLMQQILQMFDDSIEYYDTDARKDNPDNEETIDFIVDLAVGFKTAVADVYKLFNEKGNEKLN